MWMHNHKDNWKKNHHSTDPDIVPKHFTIYDEYRQALAQDPFPGVLIILEEPFLINITMFL